ncbi:MAG TPA: response regulator transcription factor [Dehalococcoidia bacterium]|nr:response regulator transcription factor [Dehalococcoidia bacterium]
MIARNELQAMEEEIKYRLKACLALAAALRFPELATELRAAVAARASAPEEEPSPSVVVLGSGPEATNLCTAFQQQGIKVGVVGGLNEAVALTEKKEVRLVVVDEAFIDSSSTCWQLRQHKTLPIVLLGARHDKEGWERAFELEADAYLSKSKGLAEQVARVKAILRRY